MLGAISGLIITDTLVTNFVQSTIERQIIRFQMSLEAETGRCRIGEFSNHARYVGRRRVGTDVACTFYSEFGHIRQDHSPAHCHSFQCGA